MQCKCESFQFYGSWAEDQETERNRPCWKCCACDSFVSWMSEEQARLFRARYFSVDKRVRGARTRFCREYQINCNPRSPNSRYGRPGYGKTWVRAEQCGAPTKAGGMCTQLGTKPGGRCWIHYQQLSLF